jgi:NAD(P)-dependent dehydrogenase (short-subunit alcohol dehydrogenase family)
MSSFLITGAGRGLGFGLVERLASQPASEVKLVIASARKTSDALTKLAAANPGRVFIVTLEVTDVPSVQKAAEQVRAILKEHNATLDVLFNNAGILNRLPNSVLAMYGPRLVFIKAL